MDNNIDNMEPEPKIKKVPGAADAVLAKKSNSWNFQSLKTYHNFIFCWNKFKEVFMLPELYYRELDMALYMERENYIFPLPRSESELIKQYFIAIAQPWGNSVDESNYNQVVHGVLETKWHTTGNPLGEVVDMANVHCLPTEIKLCVMYFLFGLRMNSIEGDAVDVFYNNKGLETQELGRDAAGNMFHYFGEARIVVELASTPLYKHLIDDEIMATAPWKDTYGDHTCHPAYVIVTQDTADCNELLTALINGTKGEKTLAGKIKDVYDTDIRRFLRIGEEPNEEDNEQAPVLEAERYDNLVESLPPREKAIVPQHAPVQRMRVVMPRQRILQSYSPLQPLPSHLMRQQVNGRQVQYRIQGRSGVVLRAVTPAERVRYKLPPLPVANRPVRIAPPRVEQDLADGRDPVVNKNAPMNGQPDRRYRVVRGVFHAAHRAPARIPAAGGSGLRHRQPQTMPWHLKSDEESIDQNIAPQASRRHRSHGHVPYKCPELIADPRIYIQRAEVFRDADFYSYYSAFKPTFDEITNLTQYKHEILIAQHIFGNDFLVARDKMRDSNMPWKELETLVNIMLNTVMPRKTNIIQELEFFMTSCYGDDKRTHVVEHMIRLVKRSWDVVFKYQIEEDILCKRLLDNMWGYVEGLLDPLHAPREVEENAPLGPHQENLPRARRQVPFTRSTEELNRYDEE